MSILVAMSSFRIRPRFKHELTGEQDEIEAHILESAQKSDLFKVSHLKGHIYIKMHPSRQHLWSPQLHLTFEEADDQVVVRGLYGPNPTLWAIFFFGYTALGLLSLFIGMWGLSRHSLGMSSHMLWLIPLFGLLALGLYISAQAGQKLGAQDMFDMHHLYEEAVRGKVKVT